MEVRRVVVTNTLSHQNMGHLLGALTHGKKTAVLNNHHCAEDALGNCLTNVTYIYEDNGENDIPGSQATDGPGRLTQFNGERGEGVGFLTMVDSAAHGATGRVEGVSIRLEPRVFIITAIWSWTNIQPNSFAYGSVQVPPEAHQHHHPRDQHQHQPAAPATLCAPRVAAFPDRL